MKKIFIKIVVFCIVFLAAYCASKKQFVSKPTKSVVNPDSELLEVNAVAYHTNDSTTLTFLEIKNENLIYKRPDTTNAFYADIRITYKLLNEPNSRRIIDSGSYRINDRASETVQIKSLTSKFSLKAKNNADYYLDIQVFDLNKKIRYAKGLNIYKKNSFTEQNFLITLNDAISFKTHFLRDENVIVKFSNPSITNVTVNCFLKEFGPALPPFSIKTPDEFKYKPDSVFKMDLSTNQFQLTMPKQGFLYVTPNENTVDGVTLYTYDKTFPGVSNSEEMINCTRYLMSKDEFETCKNAEDKKAAIDNFWINIAGSKERAKELLKRYYGRVKEANKYYTSYAQGWKTDRGMIFIVFGHPTNIYKSSKNEIWVYGVETNANALRFVFDKAPNPFSDNDYILERSQFFKDPYYTAVDYWREGRVYSNNSR
ncbi:MAG: GWxTD domain-containing protein [Bacteroidetes bacterium]|nr:GWxTD domain-containing protein [Bacteroidota bacterium]